MRSLFGGGKTFTERDRAALRPSPYCNAGRDRQRNAVNTSKNQSYMGCSSSADVCRHVAGGLLGKLVAGDRTSKRSRKQVLSSPQAWYREQYRFTRTEYAKRYRTILFLQGPMRCQMAHQRYLHQLRSVAVVQRLFRRVQAQKLRFQSARRIQQRWQLHHRDILRVLARSRLSWECLIPLECLTQNDMAVSQSQPSLGKNWPRTKCNRNSKSHVTFATVLLLPYSVVSDCIKPEQHS